MPSEAVLITTSNIASAGAAAARAGVHDDRPCAGGICTAAGAAQAVPAAFQGELPAPSHNLAELLHAAHRSLASSAQYKSDGAPLMLTVALQASAALVNQALATQQRCSSYSHTAHHPVFSASTTHT